MAAQADDASIIATRIAKIRSEISAKWSSANYSNGDKALFSVGVILAFVNQARSPLSTRTILKEDVVKHVVEMALRAQIAISSDFVTKAVGFVVRNLWNLGNKKDRISVNGTRKETMTGPWPHFSTDPCAACNWTLTCIVSHAACRY